MSAILRPAKQRKGKSATASCGAIITHPNLISFRKTSIAHMPFTGGDQGGYMDVSFAGKAHRALVSSLERHFLLNSSSHRARKRQDNAQS
ncbi:hypothetical protein FQN60_015634, partial [Etheostoma spectabile]